MIPLHARHLTNEKKAWPAGTSEKVTVQGVEVEEATAVAVHIAVRVEVGEVATAVFVEEGVFCTPVGDPVAVL